MYSMLPHLADVARASRQESVSLHDTARLKSTAAALPCFERELEAAKAALRVKKGEFACERVDGHTAPESDNMSCKREMDNTELKSGILGKHAQAGSHDLSENVSPRDSASLPELWQPTRGKREASDTNKRARKEIVVTDYGVIMRSHGDEITDLTMDTDSDCFGEFWAVSTAVSFPFT